MSDALCAGVLSILEDKKVPLSLDHIHQTVGMSIPISQVEFNINQLCDIGIVTKVGAKYICTSDLERLSPPQQVRKVEDPLPVNTPVERRTDVSGNLSLSPYLRDRTTQGSPRTPSGQIVPRGAGPITRSRINDQVTLCSENLPVVTFPGREQKVIEISNEVKQLLRVLEEAPGPLKAMQAATKAGIKDRKRCNQLLYYLEARGLVEKSGPAWKLCSRPEVSEEDILAYSSELYVKHEANKTPPVNEANDRASSYQGGLHLHVNNHYMQVGNNNVMNVMSQNNFRSERQSE